MPIIFRPRTVSSLAGGLFLALLAVGCGKAEQKGEEEHPAPVKVAVAEKVRLGGWTELLGTTQPLPDRVARVSAAVEGHVQSVLKGEDGSTVSEGQQIKAGQVIARLDDHVARANRDKLAAQIDEQVEQKKQAGYAVNLAEVEVKRLERLRRGASGSSSLVSQVEIDKAQIALKDARSKQRAVASREATLRAELKALDAQLAYYTLSAPIGGQLGLLQIGPGQTVHTGTVVAEVVDLAEIDALCFVPPRTALLLGEGKPARLVGNEKVVGKVVFIAVQAQADTGNFAVKVRFPNSEPRLRANTVVRVEVLTTAEADRLVVPQAAVLEDQEPPAVILVDKIETKKKDDKEEKLGEALKVPVKLGIRGRVKKKDSHGKEETVDVVEVLLPHGKEKSPLVKGSLVVVDGAQGLEDKDKLKLEEEEEEAK
jgi:multidrug efflux system membrane fusion protein